MNDKRTRPLQLDEPIVTGNTKAAVKAAGGKSADLWMVPYEQIHYDPRDNVRPLDVAWAKHLGKLIAADGYDKSQPLHCYIRKENGHDSIYVWKGQHRYHGIGYAIKEGVDVGLIPLVIIDAKSVNRVNMIFGGLTSNDSKRTSPLELAEKIAELRDVHGIDIKTICQRLNITDQTVRDVALLETAPAELHKLVREGVVAGTLAIDEIRKHGAEKALERLAKGAADAKAAGKARVTKKHLEKPSNVPAPRKITDAQAKQLLQALQALLHDPMFGKLSPGTIDGVHAALSPLADMLDANPVTRSKYPINKPNANGVYTYETIAAPKPKGSRSHLGSPAEIHLSQIELGKWIFSVSYRMGTGAGSSSPSLSHADAVYRTRQQAIRGAVQEFTRRLHDPRLGETKEAPGVRKWLDKLWTAPDPDWTEDLPEAAKATVTVPQKSWPYPTAFPTGDKP